MFFKKDPVVNSLIDENKKLKENLADLKDRLEQSNERRYLFESIFFNCLDGIIDKYFPDNCIQRSARFQIIGEPSFKEVVPEEIEEIIKEMETSFSDRLMEIIRERKLNEVEVYKKADLDRRLFCKIRNNHNYRPTKDTAILLCMSMKLSYEDTVDLLKRAGMALSQSNITDLIAAYFINNGIYDIPLYKEVLYRYSVLGDY